VPNRYGWREIETEKTSSGVQSRENQPPNAGDADQNTNHQAGKYITDFHEKSLKNNAAALLPSPDCCCQNETGNITAVGEFF